MMSGHLGRLHRSQISSNPLEDVDGVTEPTCLPPCSTKRGTGFIVLPERTRDERLLDVFAGRQFYPRASSIRNCEALDRPPTNL